MSTPLLPRTARIGLTPQGSPVPSLPSTPVLSRRNSLDGKREAASPSPPAAGSSTGKRGGLHPGVVILGWIALSTAVIFQNREILVGKHFNYPVTLTTLHLAFQSIATRLLHRFTSLISGPVPQGEYASVPLRETGDEDDAGSGGGSGSDKAAMERWKRQSVEMDWSTWAREILPIACLFSLSLVLSNAAYLYCSVAFIHILKSFSPVAILLAAFIFRTKAFSYKLLFIVLVISFGVGIASYGEVAFSPTGFAIQMVAIAVEATRVTLIQLLLSSSSSSSTTSSSSDPSSKPPKPKSSLSMSPLKSLYFLAPVCLALNFSFLLLLEGAPALRAIPRLGLWTVLLNCSLTFGLNLSAVMLIGLSAMVLSLSKVVKDVLLVISPALLLGESLTPTQVVGYGIATVGLLVYKFSPN
ncbi:hypothetical protein JCM6882_008551 [Rhodosporidiobolus microsporus]